MSMGDQIKLMNGEFPHTTMWFGMIRGQWPVRSFSIASHATDWLAGAGPNEQRYLWRADVINATRLELVPPIPAYLRDAPAPAADDLVRDVQGQIVTPGEGNS